MEARGDHAGIRRLFLTATRWVLYIVLPVNLGLWFFGRPFLVRWVPAVGADAVPPLAVLSATLTVGVAQSAASRVLYGLGRLKLFARLALAEAGLPPRPEYERVTDWGPEAGAAAAAELLALAEPPTAVFAGSDSQALGVLEAARQARRRVPEDLAVVGYNDIEVATYLGLTTVRVPMRELGRRGVELLLRAIEQPEAPPEQVRLPAELVIRRSSGAGTVRHRGSNARRPLPVGH
jgi:hypothetical protein